MSSWACAVRDAGQRADVVVAPGKKPLLCRCREFCYLCIGHDCGALVSTTQAGRSYVREGL